MGEKTSDITGLYACINHPDRMVQRRRCAAAERDGIPDQFCICCDECAAECLTIPHGHGGTDEWEDGVCKICGADVTRWL